MKRILALSLALVALAVTAGVSIAGAPVKPNTLPASNVTSTTATLNGHIFPDESVTTYYFFQYGTTTAYGSQTQTEGPVKGTDKDVSTNITGLAPSTTYHYRVAATNTDGTTYGDNMTFTTPAAGTNLPGNTTNPITIDAKPSTVVFTRATTISGRLTGPNNSGVQVTLEENPHPYTAGFKNTNRTAVTTNSGAYSLTVTPGVNTRYRVTAKTKPPVTSPEKLVNVRPRVSLRLSDSTPRVGQRVRFFGTVLPAHNGKVVRIQRRTSTGRWRTIASTTLVATTPVNGVARSKYSRRIRVRRDGTFRARVSPADGDHVTGFSPRRTARVH